MTLKLPDVLPYDFVDKMLDEKFKFGWEVWTADETYDDIVEGEEYRQPWARRREDNEISNYGRSIFDLMHDTPYFSSDSGEDEDGYIEWIGGAGMEWTAKDLSDEEIDKILDEQV